MTDTWETSLRLRFHTVCPICNSKNIRNIGLRYNASQGLFPCKKGQLAVSAFLCLHCDCIFANPMPINVSQFYDSENPEEYFDVILTRDDALKRWESIKTFMQNHIGNPDKALDVGSGIGIWTNHLSKWFNEVVAIEPSSVFFNELQKRIHGLQNVQAFQYTLEQFAKHNPKPQFDLIFIHEVLEHVPDPTKMLDIATNLLRNNGIIYICVPNNRWITYDIVKLAYALTGRCFTPHLAPIHPPYHLYEFSKHTFRYFASELNLDLVAMRTRPERTYMPKPLHYLVKFLSKLFDKGYEIEVILKKSA